MAQLTPIILLLVFVLHSHGFQPHSGPYSGVRLLFQNNDEGSGKSLTKLFQPPITPDEVQPLSNVTSTEAVPERMSLSVIDIFLSPKQKPSPDLYDLAASGVRNYQISPDDPRLGVTSKNTKIIQFNRVRRSPQTFPNNTGPVYFNFTAPQYFAFNPATQTWVVTV